MWIGSNSTILPGITVGDWAVIGAGSVVTKDVESFTIVAGNPARVIRRLTEELSHALACDGVAETGGRDK